MKKTEVLLIASVPFTIYNILYVLTGMNCYIFKNFTHDEPVLILYVYNPLASCNYTWKI